MSDKPAADSGSLARLAQRLSANPIFMGYVLAAYAAQENLSEDALAQQLGISRENFVKLAICKRPPATQPDFAGRVRRIAAYIEADAAQLAFILRQVNSLENLTSFPTSQSGWLAAARDREPATETEPEDSEETD